MNLPQLYQSVCSVRPEAEVPKLCRSNSDDESFWYRDEDRGCGKADLADDEAAALIESRWMDLLGEDDGIVRDTSGWMVFAYTDREFINGTTGPTRIEALAAYLIATTEKQ